jgi:hypothetical protein
MGNLPRVNSRREVGTYERDVNPHKGSGRSSSHFTSAFTRDVWSSPGSSRPESDVNLNPAYPSYQSRSGDVDMLSDSGFMDGERGRQRNAVTSKRCSLLVLLWVRER